MCKKETVVEKKAASANTNVYSLNVNIHKEIEHFGVEKKLNDYVGVQKAVLPKLEQQDFFEEIVNEETGIIIEITRKGIKETLGSGKRFQNLPKILKELKIATLRSLPELIRVAKLNKDNVMNFHGNAARYAYLRIEANINGVSVQIRIDVQRTSAKNKFWLHMINIKEEIPITQS